MKRTFLLLILALCLIISGCNGSDPAVETTAADAQSENSKTATEAQIEYSPDHGSNSTAAKQTDYPDHVVTESGNIVYISGSEGTSGTFEGGSVKRASECYSLKKDESKVAEKRTFGFNNTDVELTYQQSRCSEAGDQRMREIFNSDIYRDKDGNFFEIRESDGKILDYTYRGGHFDVAENADLTSVVQNFLKDQLGEDALAEYVQTKELKWDGTYYTAKYTRYMFGLPTTESVSIGIRNDLTIGEYRAYSLFMFDGCESIYDEEAVNTAISELQQEMYSVFKNASQTSPVITMSENGNLLITSSTYNAFAKDEAATFYIEIPAP